MPPASARPFELINGWIWPNIHEHYVLRTAAEIRETAVLPIANDAATMFIDQVDPIGSSRVGLAAGH